MDTTQTGSLQAHDHPEPDTEQHEGRERETIPELLASLEAADPADAPAIADEVTERLGRDLDATEDGS